MRKLFQTTVAALALQSAALALATPSIAKPVSKYEACLVKLIAAKGFKYAVDHAGATICDKR